MPSMSRPRTPSRSPAPPTAPPPVPQDESQDSQQPPARRPSFNFLKRSKSGEKLKSKRSVSGGKLTKRPSNNGSTTPNIHELEGGPIPRGPPLIPNIKTQPQMQSFGGDSLRANPNRHAMTPGLAGQYEAVSRSSYDPSANGSRSESAVQRPKASPYGSSPRSDAKQESVDPYARTESMTNRGRYSYASSAVSTINSPRRVRRRKDPTPFNVLVVGARNSGKTSVVDFIKASLALPMRKHRPSTVHPPEDFQPVVSPLFPTYIPHYLETELSDGERVGLTLWDSDGLEPGIMDLQLRDLIRFIESKFEETFNEENKVARTPGFRDTHIHCVILALDPLRLDANISAAVKRATEKSSQAGGANGNKHFSNTRSYLHEPSPSPPTPDLSGLDDSLDLPVLRALSEKTTVIPIISKADTITQVHMGHLKRVVWDSLKKSNPGTLEALGLDEDSESESDSGSEVRSRNRPVGRHGGKRHGRHDSRVLDERDEDALDSSSDGEDRPASQLNANHDMTSHLSTSSSDFTDDEPAHSSSATPSKQSPPKPKQKVSDKIPHLPLSILTPDPITSHIPVPGQVGRRFAWGSADPYNASHCDFVRFREAVFLEWRGELREASREIWYERWRTGRLGGKPDEKILRDSMLVEAYGPDALNANKAQAPAATAAPDATQGYPDAGAARARHGSATAVNPYAQQYAYPPRAQAQQGYYAPPQAAHKTSSSSLNARQPPAAMGYSAQAYATHPMDNGSGLSYNGMRTKQPLEPRQPAQPVYRGDEDVDDVQAEVGMAI